MDKTDEDGELVEVWRGWGEPEAQLVRGLLESNGIGSTIRGESLRLTHAFTMDGLAKVKLLVRKEDAARAKELISQADQLEDGESIER